MWGYNFYLNWLIAAIAVWGFDRIVRVLRILKNGVCRAVVTEVGTDHVRVDIPGIRWASKPGHVAYAYFPTLNPLRPWENHPFSINSTALFRSYKHAFVPEPPKSVEVDHSSSDEGRAVDMDKDTEKPSARVSHDVATTFDTSGVTLIIKKSGGLTRLLKKDARMVTLLDGPYPQSPRTNIQECDHVLLIGGGIGITGLLPWIHSHPNIKLAWSVKSSHEALVRELDVELKNVAEKDIVVGERLSVEDLLRTEMLAGHRKVGVVVCGPGAMCDDVRAKVAGLGRSSKTVFELEVDAFSW
jgi:predicted ferric reductase